MISEAALIRVCSVFLPYCKKKMYKGMQSSIESKTILNELIPIDHFL